MIIDLWNVYRLYTFMAGCISISAKFKSVTEWGHGGSWGDPKVVPTPSLVMNQMS